MNEKLAMEILKQVELQETTGCCEKCPRKDGTCIGCLDEAKNILINYTTKLQSNWNSLRECIEKQREHYRYFKDNRYRRFLSDLVDKMNKLEGKNNNGK